jgi:uncharacterized membrane protein YccC
MPWILLLLGFFCFGLLLSPGIPFPFAVVLVLSALGFMIAAILSFLSQRLQSNSRDDTKMISPEDLRMMREQAAARKAAAAQNSENGTN